LDRPTDSETGKEIEDKIKRFFADAEKGITEAQDESHASFLALNQVLQSGEKPAEGGIIIPTTPEMREAFTTYVRSRIQLHKRHIDFANTLLEAMLRADTSKVDPITLSLRDLTIMVVGDMRESNLGSLACLALLLLLGQLTFTGETTVADDDTLTKLKNFKQELVDLQESEGKKIASVNMLIWENWKKRGII